MSIFRHILPFVLCIFVFVVVLSFHQYQQYTSRLEEGNRYQLQGAITEAIEQYEWAIQCYVPWVTPTQTALNELMLIAEHAEREGDLYCARDAWQAVASGLAVIRHVRQPYAERRIQAENNLTRLNQTIQRNNHEVASETNEISTTPIEMEQ